MNVVDLPLSSRKKMCFQKEKPLLDEERVVLFDNGYGYNVGYNVGTRKRSVIANTPSRSLGKIKFDEISHTISLSEINDLNKDERKYFLPILIENEEDLEILKNLPVQNHRTLIHISNQNYDSFLFYHSVRFAKKKVIGDASGYTFNSEDFFQEFYARNSMINNYFSDLIPLEDDGESEDRLIQSVKDLEIRKYLKKLGWYSRLEGLLRDDNPFFD